MTRKDRIDNEYFNWIYDVVCRDRYSNEISYKKLFMRLHNTEFTYIIPRDRNRASDGIELRYRFAYENKKFSDAESYLEGPCSVLEMLVALSIRCEESIMDDPSIGNRTGQWFWSMVTTLGLGHMDDANFDKQEVDRIVNRFLNREYASDGRGGLFIIRNAKRDLRRVEIWYQLCWYLNNIV